MPVRKISRLHNDLIGIISKVADVMKLKDIDYLIETGTDEIDCFFGGLHKVNIKGVTDGFPVKIGVIIKWHPNPADRMCFRAAYQREYVFYQYIVPKMLRLQRNYNVIEGLKMKFPNCILADMEQDKETIVIATITDYNLTSRFSKLEFVKSALVVKNMAKLHALSFGIEKRYPEEFQDIRNQCDKDVQYSDITHIPKSLLYYFKQSLSVVNNPEAKTKLETILPNILTLLSKCSAPAPNYSTICHGDCWNNNILFKYQGKIPVDVLFVDFQLVRYASPVTDLSYYLYMSADQEFLSKHYDQLMDIYYGTLSAVLRQCNLDVSHIYPRNIFEQHLKDFSVLGLLEALISMKIITAQSEEALMMTEIKYHKSEDSPQYETQNHMLFVKRVNGVVNDFFSRGYSLDSLLNS